MKLYKYGLVLGRFQTLHNGHEHIIKYALELCDKVVVYVGSSQESGTERNPFSYNIRKNMIEEVFTSEVTGKKLLIRPLPDMGIGNNYNWGKYILSMFEKEFYRQPDLYITGCEKERGSWFSDEDAPRMDELRITRNGINISASECREYMLNGDYENWCKVVPYELHNTDRFNQLRNILKDIKEK